MTENELRTKLASVIRNDDIVLEEYEQDGGTITITVPVISFVEMFKGVDLTKTPAVVRGALLAADVISVDPEVVKRGYENYVRKWHKEGLLG